MFSFLHLHLYSKALYTYLCHLSKITFEIYLPPCCHWKSLHIYIPLLLDLNFELNNYYSSFISFVVMLIFLMLSLCWYTSVGNVLYSLIYVFFSCFFSSCSHLHFSNFCQCHIIFLLFLFKFLANHMDETMKWIVFTNESRMLEFQNFIISSTFLVILFSWISFIFSWIKLLKYVPNF
jgi:hypothetical protein